MNSKKIFWGIFNADYLIDILRTGAYFPRRHTFSFSEKPLNYDETKVWVKSYFPVISDDRHEVIVEFSEDETSDKSGAFSLIHIIGVHFFTGLRQGVELKRPIGQVLQTYSIPILPPVDNNPIWTEILDAYQFIIRDHAARTIIKSWFKNENGLTKEFCNEVEIGFKYQQSPQPWLLPQLKSNQSWAYVIAYNPSSRPFEEIPKILVLQDLEVVLKGMPEEVKDQLKALGLKLNTKYKDEIKPAEAEKSLSIWVFKQLIDKETYLSQLDKILTNQPIQSLILSCMLYFYWRDLLIDKDYKGNLKDIKEVYYYLSKSSESEDLRFVYQIAIIQALYTVFYVGGAVTFKQALKEARFFALGINQGSKKVVIPMKEPEPELESIGWVRKFQNFPKNLLELLGKNLIAKRKKKSNEKIKTEPLKKILTDVKLKKGEINAEELTKYCLLLDIPVEDVIEEVEKTLGKKDEKKRKNEDSQITADIKLSSLPKIKIESENVTNLNSDLPNNKELLNDLNDEMISRKKEISSNETQMNLFDEA